MGRREIRRGGGVEDGEGKASDMVQVNPNVNS